MDAMKHKRIMQAEQTSRLIQRDVDVACILI